MVKYLAIREFDKKDSQNIRFLLKLRLGTVPKNVFLSALTVAVANLFSFYQQFPVNFINEFSYE